MPVEGQITVGEMVEKLEKHGKDTLVYTRDNHTDTLALPYLYSDFYHFQWFVEGEGVQCSVAPVLVIGQTPISGDKWHAINEERRAIMEGGEE